MSPAIKDGDHVVFVACGNGDLKNGDVLVALNERNEALMKRYCIKEDAVYLVSNNRNYPTFKIGEQHNLTGKVLDIWRRINP
jgi:SOS-response transcriptional repressor LexA